jgi:hypothetical protein
MKTQLVKPERILTNASRLREHPAPLWHVYSGELHPQDAFVELDPAQRRAEADWNAEVGSAVPMRVWHGRCLRYGVDPALSGEQIADLLDDDDVQALMLRICEGHSVEWDGSNEVGALTADAQEAFEALDALLRQVPGEAEIWDADYIAEGARLDPALTADSTDEDIQEIARGIEADAKDEHAYITCDVADVLADLRADMRRDATD